MTHRIRMLSIALAAAGGIAAAPASAVDLAVSSIEVTQGFQNGSTGLTAGRATMIRVKVAVTGSAGSVAGVDGVLRMVVNGVDWFAGPYFSQNGPISAPLAPSSSVLDHTLNFIVVPPQSSNVVFKVLVNPTGSIAESSTANNLFTSGAYDFKCRGVVDLAYVPINYGPGGGLPDPSYMIPGSGDNFVRGIYPVGEWNYHRSPLGNLTWNSNVNNTASALLGALMDLRNTLIPDAGYAKPEFVYGFLPGNPYSGNGLANAIPGIVAFGNTEAERWQRTFAHEIGHLWGLQHNGSTAGIPCIDVEHELKDPLEMPQLQPSSKNDVMVAGLVTSQAWVASGTYSDAWTDSRSQCIAFGPDGGGSNDPESDAEHAPRAAAPADEQRCLRVLGTLVHDGRRLSLEPVTRMDRASPTIDDPAGDIAIETLDAAGRPLHRVRVRTDTMLESCSGGGEAIPTACVYALLPEPSGELRAERVVVRDLRAAPAAARAVRGGVDEAPILASIERSANPPSARIVAAQRAIAPAAQGAGGDRPMIEVLYEASDPDGDPLQAMLLYSPNGGSRWAPVSVRADGGSIVFDPSNLPGALPGQGRLRLRVSDGLNIVDDDGAIEAMFMEGNPPDVHVISPNEDSYKQGASLLFHASGWDMEDEYLPDASFQWTSDLDGPIATGRLLTKRSLSPGVHLITLTGTDSDGMSSEDTITVTITGRAIPDADFNDDGVVDGDDLGTLLGNWGAFGVGDLDFNGTVDGSDLGLLLGEWTQ